MTRLQTLIEFLHELETVTPDNARIVFSKLFPKGAELLQLDDRALADEFEAALATVRRWKSGQVVPYASRLVLQFLAEAVEKEIHKLSEN